MSYLMAAAMLYAMFMVATNVQMLKWLHTKLVKMTNWLMGVLLRWILTLEDFRRAKTRAKAAEYYAKLQQLHDNN